MPEVTRLRLLVTVKAYPTVSLRHSELVCCAGIREDTREWVRLYPVAYRTLPGWQKFDKYDVIEVDCVRRPPHKDDQPESWSPRMETLKTVGKVPVNRPGDWSNRLSWIRPTLLRGFAELLDLQRTTRKSLAAFKPAKILGFKVEPEREADWNEAQRASLDQTDMYHQEIRTLEKIPCAFRVGFTDERGGEHWLKVIDWEFMELWRKERDHFGSEEVAADQVRKKLDWIARGDKEVIMYAGNLADPRMRRSFIILGFCYPKDEPQMTLF